MAAPPPCWGDAHADTLLFITPCLQTVDNDSTAHAGVI